MARTATSKIPEEKEENATLQISRTDATERINAQIKRGDDLISKSIQSQADYDALVQDKGRWNDRNEQLLGTIFSNSAVKTKYRYQGAGVVIMSMHESPLYEQIQEAHESISRKNNALRSILENLDLFPEPGLPLVTPVVAIGATQPSGNKIFVVHGHDDGLKQSTARFLERLNLVPIILHEQPNGGQTVIEKFEANADVSYAVVLLTPDDFGAAVGDESKPRARQNVILELGYFIGRLNRNKVVALYLAGVELPSDLNGVLYIPVDERDAWKLELAKEIKNAGLPVDMNLV